MKKLALIAAVVFTTLTIQSCREADEVLSPQEAATLQRVQDSSNNLLEKNSTDTINNQQSAPPTSNIDGELVPPPKK